MACALGLQDFKTFFFPRLQDFIINFLKNIFASVLAPQIAMASLGGPGMIRKENNLLKSAFLQRSSKTLRGRSMGRGKEKGAKKGALLTAVARLPARIW